MPVMSSSSWSLYVNHIFNLCDYDNGTLKWFFLSIAYCYRVEPLTLLILYLSYVLWPLTLLILYLSYVLAWTIYWTSQGRIQDFKLAGGGALKKIARAEGDAKNFWVFRVKNHDFTPKKSDFFQMQREARKFVGYFVWKITILRQKIIFFPILGPPPWIRPCEWPLLYYTETHWV